MMNQKIPIGILAGTGMVGQRYIQLLENHPWFKVVYIAASPKSAGKTYENAVEGRWHMDTNIPQDVSGIIIKSIENINECKQKCKFVFSALSSSLAKEWEDKYAENGIPVISNAGYHRNTKDVPMLIPEINADHCDIIPLQKLKRGWDTGFIAVKPNCSLQSYMIPLYAIHKKYPLKKIIVTTMQAVSGSGYPGNSSFDLIDNVLPFISGEEEKSEIEPLKILGKIMNGEISDNDSILISAHCNRVATIDGHMACVSFECEGNPSIEEIKQLWNSFTGLPQQLNLPFAPKKAIKYFSENNRPQPRLDRNCDKGMTISVGRLRECNTLSFKFVALSNNVIRGAAGGGILNAELLVAKGFIN